MWYINVIFIKFIKFTTYETVLIYKFSSVFSFMRHPIHEIWRDTYFDVIEEWRQRYGNGHLEIRKIKINRQIYLIQLDVVFKKKFKSVIYLLFSYQTGYIMWHSRLTMYIPFGCASGNIDPKPGMSHYIPCLIAE